MMNIGLKTKLFTLLLLIVTLLPAQLRRHQIELYPNVSDTLTGEVRFEERRANGVNYVGFQAADSIASTVVWTLPSTDSTGSQCLASNGSTILGWTACSAGGTAPFVDTTSIVEGSADNTKEIRFEVDGLTTGTVRVLTPPNANITIAGINLAQTWTATQTFQNIAVSADSAYDIATSATRVRWGFADIWNAERLEIANAAHSANFTISNTASGLLFENTGGGDIVLFAGSEIVTMYSLVRPDTAVGTDLGSAGFPFDDVWGDAFKVDGNDAILGILEIYEGVDGGQIDIYDDDLSLTNLRVTIEKYGITGFDESGNTMYRLASATDTGGGGILRLRDTGGTSKFLADGDGNLNLNGTIGFLASQTTGAGEGAQLIRITKDSAATIEADNLSISGDGNFYMREFSGDVDCATGSVDNGWMGVQTTAHEIQFCSGSTTRFVPSTTSALPPLTLNCTAGQVVLDPRWENGILVEGACGAN